MIHVHFILALVLARYSRRCRAAGTQCMGVVDTTTSFFGNFLILPSQLFSEGSKTPKTTLFSGACIHFVWSLVSLPKSDPDLSATGQTESVHDQMMTVKKNKWIAAKQPRVKKGGRRESFILVLVRCVETRPPVG